VKSHGEVVGGDREAVGGDRGVVGGQGEADKGQ
jgi:hypothetical protein